MKKIKKMMAALLAMVMMLAMTTTAFAAGKLTSNITVKGLTDGVKTTLNAYQAVSYNQDANDWVVADWANAYIRVDEAKNAYVIDDAEGLGKAAESQVAKYTGTAMGTEHVFENVEIGAYVILATDTKTTYTTMVANTYDEAAEYIAAKDETINAKASGSDLDKKAEEGDKFVGRGETVTFTVTTTFPNFEVADSKDNTFKIVDTPTGLDITKVTSLTIGGDEFTNYTTEEAENGVFTIDLTNAIGTKNENAGKTIVVTYEAVVTTDEGYSNTANAMKNEKDYGTDTEKGYTADITITKYASDNDNNKLENNTKLAGAKFKVHENNKEGKVLSFVKVSDGVYKLAMADEEGAVEEIEVAGEGDAKGTVKVTGLAEGTYFFEETKAPEGYSINEDGVTVTVEAKDDANVSATGHLIDTKLASLPGTGGIGTTIFTIGGCIIMIAAAGFYFLSRKKENN